MQKQRNTTQMKEHIKIKIVQLNEQEKGKLHEKKFRIMVVKMTNNLEKKMEKMQESINKNLEELKKKHTETSTVTEIKNTPEGIRRRISEAKE